MVQHKFGGKRFVPKTGCARSHEQESDAMLLSMEVQEKTLSSLNFSKPSGVTRVQILGIDKQCNKETVNIIFIKIKINKI